EREQVVRAIARDRPAFLALNGDLVFDGSSAGQWAAFDLLTAPLRDAGIPAFAALGNHEYWASGGDVSAFFLRFPSLSGKHFYTVAYGPLRLVVLDTNVDQMTPEGWDAQRRWFEETLR